MAVKKERNRHLTDDLRLALEAALRERKPFAQISRETGIPRSTIRREVVNRRVESTKTSCGRRFNPCVRRDRCDAAGMCGRPDCARSCASCGLRCREGLCPRFVDAVEGGRGDRRLPHRTPGHLLSGRRNDERDAPHGT